MSDPHAGNNHVHCIQNGSPRVLIIPGSEQCSGELSRKVTGELGQIAFHTAPRLQDLRQALQSYWDLAILDTAFAGPDLREVLQLLKTHTNSVILVGNPLPARDIEIGAAEGVADFIDLNDSLRLGHAIKRELCQARRANETVERKKLEDQLMQTARLEAVGRLAGGIAHDMNNLLSVVQGQASLLLWKEKRPRLDPITDRAVKEMSLAAERAVRLTRQLLLFTRNEAVKIMPLDLTGIITETLQMLSRIVGEDIEIVEALDPDLPSIHADEGMLQQVFMNLAINARDAMPRGGSLQIRTFSEDIGVTKAPPEARAGEYVCLEIRDTGSGIAPENIDRIFDPFFTTKGPGKGTGLGLSIVKGIVNQLGGWIRLESSVGKGTTFRLYFPALERAIKPADKPIEEDFERGSGTVLVVEDEQLFREMTSQMLTRNGYLVFEASTAAEALNLWPRIQDGVDLLLSDLILPGGINGWELGIRLVAQRPQLKVIGMSGYNPDVIGCEEPLIEGQNFLQKPFSLGHLLNTVAAVLQQRIVAEAKV